MRGIRDREPCSPAPLILLLLFAPFLWPLVPALLILLLFRLFLLLPLVDYYTSREYWGPWLEE